MTLYADRDIENQEDCYLSHIAAMTDENLNGKSEIAAELAHRDLIIQSLAEALQEISNYGISIGVEGCINLAGTSLEVLE